MISAISMEKKKNPIPPPIIATQATSCLILDMVFVFFACYLIECHFGIFFISLNICVLSVGLIVILEYM